MRKTILLLFFSLVITVITFAQTDSLMLATYEPGELIDRSSGYEVSKVTNPFPDAVNNSANVLKFVKITQWSSMVGLNNFGINSNPVSLFQYPFIKFKLMSDSALSKDVRVEVKDIYGYTTSVNATTQSPASVNQWQNMTVDFTSALRTTPISLIKEITIFIDYGNTPLMSRYYIDDVCFSGPKVTSITPVTIITSLMENFGNNAWFDGINSDPDNSAGTGARYDLISNLKTAAWGGSPFKGTSHYNNTDSLKFIRYDWSGAAAICVYPASNRPTLSYFYLNNFNVKGQEDLNFSYDLNWFDTPSSYSDAMTVEYQIDGGAWTALTTSSTLPTETGSWTSDITYPLTGVKGSNINFRVTNNTNARAWLDNFKFTVINIFADSMKLADLPLQKVAVGKTLQLSGIVYPSKANQDLYWYIYSGKDSISSSSGLYFAKKAGDAKVRAMCVSLPNTYKEISLQNYNPADTIKVSTKNNATTITENAGSLQLFATLKPDTADINSVAWHVIPGTGDGLIVTRNDSVFVKAYKNGTVYVKATANYGTDDVADSVLLTFSNQQLITSVVITSLVDSIKTDNGTLQLKARAFPSDAADTVVLWKIISPSDEPDTATINTSSGLLSAVRNGSVTVVAYSHSMPDVSDTIFVKIVNQIIPVTSVAIDSAVKVINVRRGSIQLSALINPAEATIKTLTWSVDNNAIATINASTGLLTAVGAINGSVVVTATANDGSNVKDSLIVTVSNQIIYVSGITISGGTEINVKGGTLALSAAVEPADADNKGVAWKVNNTSLATIDANTGLLTAKGGVNGPVIVVATAKDGSNVKGTLTVTLFNQITLVSGMTISGKSVINVKGDTAKLKVIVTPSDAANKAVTWSVDNPSIATIDSVSGILTAVANGSVVVTATANDGSNVKDTTTITITNQNTGINSIELARKVDIYPTLTTNELTIAGNTDFRYIEIFNSQGKLVTRIHNVAKDSKINVSTLSQGIYMIRITDYKNLSTTKRFVKE